MTYSQELLKAAHKHCSYNRDVINKSARCGCFYCCEIFPATEVKKYTYSNRHQHVPQDAVCPRCGIDSVLAEASGLPLEKAFLQAMYERWFEAEAEC